MLKRSVKAEPKPLSRDGGCVAAGVVPRSSSADLWQGSGSGITSQQTTPTTKRLARFLLLPFFCFEGSSISQHAGGPELIDWMGRGRDQKRKAVLVSLPQRSLIRNDDDDESSSSRFYERADPLVWLFVSSFDLLQIRIVLVDCHCSIHSVCACFNPYRSGLFAKYALLRSRSSSATQSHPPPPHPTWGWAPRSAPRG